MPSNAERSNQANPGKDSSEFRPGLWERVRTVVPIVSWFPAYPAAFLPRDALAGLSLAAYAIPVGIAYAGLAGLAPEVGLYAYLIGGIAYLLFGTVGKVSIGPTSAMAIVLGSGLAGLAAASPERHMQLVALTGLVTAGLFGVAWAFGLGQITAFVSETILLGWKAGAALVMVSTQLPALLGIPKGGDGFLERVMHAGLHWREVHLPTLFTGLIALGGLFLGDRLFPNRPIVFVVVVLATICAALIGLDAWGVATVGKLTPGLPQFELPFPSAGELRAILPTALGCFLLATVESVSSARLMSSSSKEASSDPPPRAASEQEFLALGLANAACSLGGGMPVAAGLSQSAVNAASGARTPISLLVASASIGILVIAGTGLIRDLPRPVLAAIVIAAVAPLIRPRELWSLRTLARDEFRVALFALAAVLLFGILEGMLLACIASLIILLHRVAAPHVAILGRIAGSERYTDLERHPDNERLVGVLAVRVEAGLFYFNADSVEREILARMDAAPEPVRAVVLDLSGAPISDRAGVQMVGRLAGAIERRGATLRAVEARGAVRDELRELGLEPVVGGVDRGESLPAAIRSAERDAQAHAGREASIERFSKDSSPDRKSRGESSADTLPGLR